MSDSDDDDHDHDHVRPSAGEPGVGRRRAISSVVLGTGAVIAGAVGGAAATSAGLVSGGWRRETLSFDVACLGETWRDSPVNWAENDSDFRGIPFGVEGWIYPAGTIPTPGDGFVPTRDGSIGRWLCRGSTLVYADRLEPHVHTTQEFVFGPMAGDRLFPADLITTSGLEGTAGPQTTYRPVVGGVGRYLGASGQQLQTVNGLNTSLFADGTGNTPNFTMRFELILPDL